MTGRLSGKTAIVIGSARGIGKAEARGTRWGRVAMWVGALALVVLFLVGDGKWTLRSR